VIPTMLLRAGQFSPCFTLSTYLSWYIDRAAHYFLSLFDARLAIHAPFRHCFQSITSGRGQIANIADASARKLNTRPFILPYWANSQEFSTGGFIFVGFSKIESVNSSTSCDQNILKISGSNCGRLTPPAAAYCQFAAPG
jgi:hypothetical protein